MSNDGWCPLFSSVFTGSMRGKPEELLVWFTVLGRKNREGIVDCSYRCLAEDCGLSVEVIKRCIEKFCAPDPESRSQDAGGAKLVRLPNRGFGWHVVNHDQYRDKARKQRYNEERTASGADAARKRAERASQRVPTCPAIRSDADQMHIRSETESDTPPAIGGSAEGEARSRAPRRPAKRMPVDWQMSPELLAQIVAECPLVDIESELRSIRDYEFKVAHLDWDATVRNWMRREQKDLQRKATRVMQPAARETRFNRMRRRQDEI